MNLTDLTRTEINSYSDLMIWADHLEGLSASCGPMLYRGQAQAHGNLQPTITRSNQGGAYDAAMLVERRLLDSFRKHYAEIKMLPADMPTGADLASKPALDVLSLMQHYEVPSRLLDWTESVWVAAFFACATQADTDAELWFFNEVILDPTPTEMPKSQVKTIISSSIGKRPAEYHPGWGMPYLTVIDPMSNARLSAQQGRLTASDNATSDHAGLLWRLATLKTGVDRPGEFFGRHIINKDCKRKILRFLAEEKQVSAKTLFPDIVGLGRFLRWELESLRAELY